MYSVLRVPHVTVNMCGLLSLWALLLAITAPSVAPQHSPASIHSYQFVIDHSNPYSQTESKPSPESISPVNQVSETQNQYVFTSVRNPLLGSPQSANFTLSPVRRRSSSWNSGQSGRQIMIGIGSKPLPDNLTAIASTWDPHFANGTRSSNSLRSTSHYQRLTDQQEAESQQEQPKPYYNCDSIIHDSRFYIESPHYPASYPLNRICTYYIARNRSDVCQIEVLISDMDIEDTPQCTADYLDLGGGHHQRLCGLMLRNTRRFITFPSNGTHIRITFRSDTRNSRPYRGFSAEVHQLANSCMPSVWYGNSSSIDYPSQTPQQVLHSVYGQRLYPSSSPPTRAPIYPMQTPVGDSPGKQTPFVANVPYDPQPYNSSQNRTPIYLASYCDVYLSELNGEIRSPGYPFGYPTNHSCIYTIKKAYDDVCQLELVFRHFDVQTPNVKKDLTDNCQGDYLEMPDHSRLCGYYTQAMSKEHQLKKYYLFSDHSDYLFMQFFSDNQQTPDGSGFWLEIKQLRHTCNHAPDYYQKVKCDRVITGQYSSVDRIYSPNYPQFYSPRQQCVYFVQPADSTVCEFELDLIRFNLESGSNAANEQCTKDFVQLPDRSRICGKNGFRKIFPFSKYHDRTALFYFNSDDQIEDQGFEMVLRQLPNTCSPSGADLLPTLSNANRSQSGPSLFWNNQNVYTVTDPNIWPNQPTPVFSYHNQSGLQPYQPSGFSGQIEPVSGAKSFGSGRKSFPGFAARLPGFLNNPGNVDSTGTVPLYFANGTLATRIPPLKPVDMIPFLKKGKTFVQKAATDGKNLYATGINQHNPSLLSNRFAPLSPSSFQSSDRLISARSDHNSFDLSPSLFPGSQIKPSYSCDQLISRSVEYIRSPNFPNNYPPVTRCIYSVLKTDNSVCQVRLHLLSLDLEYTSGCKNDYLQIETTGEKLCGRLSQPETRVINYYGYSRDIRLIFNSDRQTTSSGFEVRIEQVSNSCDDLRPSPSLGSAISGSTLGANSVSSRSFSDSDATLINTASNMRNDRLRQAAVGVSFSPMAQALTINQSHTVVSAPVTSGKICRTTSLMESFLESDNFPLAYPTDVDCLYKIFRANRNVCRLELEFVQFNVGNEEVASNLEMIEPSQLQLSQLQQDQRCPNDFLQIDNVQYCGRRTGHKLAVNFPHSLAEIPFRFVAVANGATNFNGFRIKVNQIDKNCRSSGQSGLDDLDFSPAIIESCPKLDLPNDTVAHFVSAPLTDSVTDPALAIMEEVVKIQSPQFGLSSELTYKPFLDCDYVLQKASRDVCAVEIRFESFSLEESRSCSKDYLEINASLRLCGKLPADTTRTFDFARETMRLHFHTDSDQNESGFAMIVRQIRC